MNRSLISVYQAMPYALRSAAASTWGYYLRWLRYGPGTDDLVDQALDRDTWNAQRWRNWREERLAFILHRAATKVPYYRRYWTERRSHGDSSSWEVLENWPLLEKESVRQNPESFVAEDCNLRGMHQWQTSGSTGTPLHLYWSRKNMHRWYALFEARSRMWYGVSRKDPWAILGGRPVASVEKQSGPSWVWNQGLNQLYLSAHHLSGRHALSTLDAIRLHKVRYIVGYPAALQILAEFAQEAYITIPLTVAITNAEPLNDTQRSLIGRMFQCPVRETYGCAEVVVGAGECEHGSMHLWPDTGIVEVFDHDCDPVPPGHCGELVCTGLVNDDMPLIRYRLGDSGALHASSARCDCGRALPLLASIEGRVDDVLITRDGRRISRVDGIFKASLPIREAQVIQESIGRIRVVYAAPEKLNGEHQRQITDRFHDVFGETTLRFEWVPRIPRLPNGKFRSVRCLVPQKEWPRKEVGHDA